MKPLGVLVFIPGLVAGPEGGPVAVPPVILKVA